MDLIGPNSFKIRLCNQEEFTTYIMSNFFPYLMWDITRYTTRSNFLIFLLPNPYLDGLSLEFTGRSMIQLALQDWHIVN